MIVLFLLCASVGMFVKCYDNLYKKLGFSVFSFLCHIIVFRYPASITMIGIVIMLVSIFTGLFPKKFLGSNIHQTGDAGVVPSMTRILSNKVIIFSGLAAIFVQTFIVNVSTIEEKYTESVFYTSKSTTFYRILSLQYLIGLLKPTVTAVSILVSGIVIYRLKPRAVILCIWSIISICITAGAIFAMIFLKCSDTPVHKEGSRNDLTEFCNKDCRCSSDIPFSPACTPFFPFVFYSPCHAGCTASYDNGAAVLYTNCSCVPTGSVEVGHCSGGTCRVFWWAFQTLTFIASACLASGFIGNLVICFRAILPCDKTIMIGTLFALSSFVARVPFKILYDFIANWTCIYYTDGHCKMYNSDKLTIFINLFHIFLLLAAAGMLSIAFFLVQDLELYSIHSTVKRNQEPVSEMSDFRSQLNQALKARRESAAEEQKLLSDPTTQPHVQAHDNGNQASLVEDDTRQRSTFNNEKRMVTLPKPLVLPPLPLVKPKEPMTPASSNHSSPPASPPRLDGTTIKNKGYLTTLL